MAAVPSVGALWRGLDGAGTVAFVIAACLAIVIAVAGRLPTKVWSGDKGAEFWADEATEVADLSMSQYTPDQLQELISSSTSSGQAQVSDLLVAGRAAQHLAFESNTSAMVKSVIRENRWQLQTWSSYLESIKLPPRRPRDDDPLIVSTGGPRRVLIDISFVYILVLRS